MKDIASLTSLYDVTGCDWGLNYVRKYNTNMCCTELKESFYIERVVDLISFCMNSSSIQRISLTS
jgi:hypothetical protein